MSKRHNQAGREFVVDRIIELKSTASSNAYTRVRSQIEQQTANKDIAGLQDALDKITSDGVVTVSEKEALRREWASLQQTYASVNEQFSSDAELSDNPTFTAMKAVYKQLSDLMAKILDDMSSDYTGEDAKQLSDLFASVYNYLTLCQSILNSRDEFLRTYSLQVIGERGILDNTTLTAGIYKDGVEQENPEFIDGQNYTWSRLDQPDGFASQKGKSILLDMDDLPISPCRFSVTWKDSSGEISDSLSVILSLTWGKIIEYAWSNALSVEELEGMMPSAWNNPATPKPSDKKYLWRRESLDNRKTYQYFRENGEDGEPGYQLVLTADAVIFTADADGIVAEDKLGFISQIVIYHGYDTEDLAGWTLSVTPDQASLISASINATGGISVTAFDKSIDNGTLTVKAIKDDITLTKIISIAKSKPGADGESGEPPKYYYKYTKTNDPDAYKGGGILFALGDKLLAVGSTLLTAGMAGWLDHVPEGTQYEDDFLWTKIVHADGSEDIIPPSKPGEPAKDIRIIASNESYQLTTRGIVKADSEFTFTLERNSVTGAATWSLDPPSGTKEMINGELIESITGEVDENNPDIFHVYLKARSTIQSFLVSVECENFEATRTLRVNGVDGGTESPYYFKVYPLSENDPLPILNRETNALNWNGADANLPTEAPDGQLITGDYILHLVNVIENASDTEPETEPIPFYYDEETSSWQMLSKDSPYYSEAMGSMLADVVAMPDMPVTVGAMYGFFQNLAAQTAFIKYLFSHNINFTGAIYAGAYDENGNNPTGGTGVYISSSGQLNAVNAILTSLYATSVRIEGEFTTEDSQGTIFAATKSVTTVSASDSETRYIAANSGANECLAGAPSNMLYLKLSGYSQKFFNGLPNNTEIFDGNFPRDGAFSASGYSYTPYLIDDEDTKDLFGKYIIARKNSLNTSILWLWQDGSDGSPKHASFTAVFDLTGNNDAIDLLILSTKIVGRSATGISTIRYGQVKTTVSIIYKYETESGGLSFTQELKSWTANDSIYNPNNYTTSKMEASLISLPAIPSDITSPIVSRTVSVAYGFDTNIQQAYIPEGQVATIALRTIPNLPAMQYNKLIYPQEQLEHNYYSYYFVEKVEGFHEQGDDLSLSVPAVVKQSATEAGVFAYSGPTASLYNQNDSLICTTSSNSDWLDAGGRLYMSCYQLYYQLRNLSDGMHTLTNSYVRLGGEGDNGTTEVTALLVETQSGQILYTLYKADSSVAKTFRYWPSPSGMLANSTNRLSGEYSLSVASSTRGVRTASIMPVSDSSYDIGSTGRRFRYGYFDRLYTDRINVDGLSMFDEISLSAPPENSSWVGNIDPYQTTSLFRLPNGFAMELIHLPAHVYSTSGDYAAWVHVYFKTAFTSPPLVFTNYVKGDQVKDADNFGFVYNVTTTGCELSTWTAFEQYVLVIGPV